MNGRRQKGWLMLLKDSENSTWGDVEKFYEDIDSEMGARSFIDLESPVWGKLHRKDLKPERGDWIGFYHTTRARFPSPDPLNRRPRISLIGKIKKIEQDGQEVISLSAEIERRNLEQLRLRPIVRDNNTEHLFKQCGMVQGSVATFYEVPPDTWSEFLVLADLSPTINDDKFNDEELNAFEGEARLAFVRHRKRESELREKKIKDAVSASLDHRLRCEVPGCGFDFEDVYGQIGNLFAEVHHLRPLSERQGDEPTLLDDLAIVCANCHRMIHRYGKNRPLCDLVKKHRLYN